MMFDKPRTPKLSRPPRYRPAGLEPKAMIPTELEINFYEDLDDLSDEALSEEALEEDEQTSQRDDEALDRALMSIEDYRSHELRPSNDGGSPEVTRQDVQCNYDDLADMVAVASQLLENDAQISRATFRLGKVILDVHIDPGSKPTLGKLVSRGLAITNKDAAITRRTYSKANEAASEFGLDALSSDELSMIEPLLESLAEMKEKLVTQLDELKVIQKSFARRMLTLDNTRKIEESIDLTRRYEMSACTTPRTSSRLAETKTSSKQETLESELTELQGKLKESEDDPRSSSRISTRISRIKTELQFLKTKSILDRTKNTSDLKNRSVNLSYDSSSERPASACSSRRGSVVRRMNWDDFTPTSSSKTLELDTFDELPSSSIALSSDLMKEQLSNRREKQELEEQRMKFEIEAEASKRKLELQSSSIATQKQQLDAERRQLQEERSLQMQMSRDNLRRRSQLQSLFQTFMDRAEKMRLSPDQDYLIQDLKEQLLY